MQGQVYSGVDSSHLFGALCKRSGKDKYPYHQQYVLVTGADGELIDALFQLQSPRNGNGVAGRQQKSYRYRHFIEIIYKQ